MRIAVFAPEGCGNALSKELLRCCGDITEIGGASLPFERAGKACRYEACHHMGLWPVVADVRRYDCFLLITRSAVHSTYSAFRRMGYNVEGYKTRGYTTEGRIETIIWQQLAGRAMLEMMDRTEVPHARVTYGNLVNEPLGTLRTIYANWEVDFPSSVDISSVQIANKNDNRWKEHETFVRVWSRYADFFK